MAYSGTVGTTVIRVQDFIDEGARRSGKLAEELTSEQQISARRSLNFLLSHLINIGIQYWAIDKKVFGLNPDQYIYSLPLGANDVLNALYRTITRPTPNADGAYITSTGLDYGNLANVFDNDIDTYAIQDAADGYFALNYGTNNPLYAGSIGFMPYIPNQGTAIWSFTYEYSTDGTSFFWWDTEPNNIHIRCIIRHTI